MSLLQDALKRQQEEQAARGGPPPRHTAPPPLPPTAGTEPSYTTSTKSPPHKPAHREWVAAAVLVGGVALLLLIIGLLVFLLRGGTAQVDPAIEVPSVADHPVPHPAPVTEAAVEMEPIIEPTPEPTIIERDDSVADSHPPVRDRPAPSPIPTPEPSTDTRATEDPGIAARWPEIRVQAAMGMGETGTVMINGSILRIGDTFDGVTVVEITGRGILMEYQGEQRLIPVRR